MAQFAYFAALLLNNLSLLLSFPLSFSVHAPAPRPAARCPAPVVLLPRAEISAPKCLTLTQIFKNCPKLLGGYRTPAPTRSRRNLPRFADWCRTRSPHLSRSSCCCCCNETSITVPKKSVPATPVNQLHHMTNRTNQVIRHGLTPFRQPIPDSAIRCRQRRQQYSEPHVQISCVCAPGTSVPRGHT